MAHWMLSLDGGPKRVNHAAVAIGDKIYSIGGYTATEVGLQNDFIDIHVLNTFTYRWERLPIFPVESTKKPRSATISGPHLDLTSTSSQSTSHNQFASSSSRRRTRSLSTSDAHPLARIRSANPPLDEEGEAAGEFEGGGGGEGPSSSSFLTRRNDEFSSTRRRLIISEEEEMIEEGGQDEELTVEVVSSDGEDFEMGNNGEEGGGGGGGGCFSVLRDENTFNRESLRELFNGIEQELANIDDNISFELSSEATEGADEFLGEEEDDDEDEEGEEEEEEEEEIVDDARMLVEVDGLGEIELPIGVDLERLEKLKQHPEIPFKRYGHTVVVYKGHIYLWGGRNDTYGCKQTLHRYDPASNLWSLVRTEGGQCCPARDGHSAIVWGDCMYIFGGYEERELRFSQETYAFHFPSSTWTKLKTTGEAPQYRDFHAVCVFDGRMYVFGGRSDETGQTHTNHDFYDDKFRFLDLKTLQWHLVDVRGEQRPCGRRSHTMWTYEGGIFLFGGFNSTNNVHFNDLWRFDPVSCTWTEQHFSGHCPTPRRRQCTVMVGRRMYLFGGTMPNPRKKTPSALEDLGDLYVLDFSPTLVSFCLQALLKYGMQKQAKSVLPKILSRELHYMSTPNQFSKTLLRLGTNMRG